MGLCGSLVNGLVHLDFIKITVSLQNVMYVWYSTYLCIYSHKERFEADFLFNSLLNSLIRLLSLIEIIECKMCDINNITAFSR